MNVDGMPRASFIYTTRTKIIRLYCRSEVKSIRPIMARNRISSVRRCREKFLHEFRLHSIPHLEVILARISSMLRAHTRASSTRGRPMAPLSLERELRAQHCVTWFVVRAAYCVICFAVCARSREQSLGISLSGYSNDSAITIFDSTFERRTL